MVRALPGNTTVQWFNMRGGRMAASMAWPTGAEPSMRAVGDGWLLFDAQGRVLHLNTERSVTTGFTIR
jgi:hypothetical protein